MSIRRSHHSSRLTTRNEEPASRRHPYVGCRVHVSGHGKSYFGEVFAFVDISKANPIVRPGKSYDGGRVDAVRLTEPFYVVVDDAGGSHYADVGEVSFL